MRGRFAAGATAVVLALAASPGSAEERFCGVLSDLSGDATVAAAGSSIGAGVAPSDDALDLIAAAVRVTERDVTVRLRVSDLVRPATPDAAGHSYFLSFSVQGETGFGLTADVFATGERGQLTTGGDAVTVNGGAGAEVSVDEARDEIAITAQLRDFAGSYLGSGSTLEGFFARSSRIGHVFIPGASRTTAHSPVDYADSAASYRVGKGCR